MNLEKSIEKFIKYTEKYDLNDSNIERKQKHSIRVMNISKEIAKKIELTQEEIEIAALIGLLHDIARFEQYKQYHTFKDNISIDHGDLGAEILNKDIREYIETNKYDEIIKLAVKNHNKYKIQEDLSQEQKIFAQIIRDADKIDILYEAVEMLWEESENLIEESTITDKVFEQIINNKQIKSKDKITPIDNVVSVIAFIFDINFKESFKILKQKDYINKVLNRYNIHDYKTKQEIEKIRKLANEYIDQKIK